MQPKVENQNNLKSFSVLLFMVLEEVINVLPEELAIQISGLITILKAVGILTILYIIWLGIRGFITMKTYKKIDLMCKDIKKIKKKLKIK